MQRLALCLTAAVLLAGCTAPGNLFDGEEETAANTGLTLSLQQLGTFATETESVLLELAVENRGQSEAESVKAQIFGPSWLSGSRSFGTLQGVDRAANQPGETAITEWELSPPNVEDGAKKSFDATAQVSYTYTTVATVPISLSPEGFTDSQTAVTAATTDGPVQLSTTLQTPIATAGATQHSIPLTVTNAGDGEITSQVDITGSLVGAGGSVGVTGCDTSVSVDNEATTTCTLTTPSDGVSFDIEAQLRVTAEYRYREETTTKVTVQAVQGAG